MEFKEASDRVTKCVRLSDIARAAGKSDAMIRRARLEPGSSAYRNPPPGWEAAIAKLARQGAARLVKLAKELEG